jgi:predicted glutamine amidotransferase
MCIAIYAPKGKVIPRQQLLEGFRWNPHGSGFAYIDNTGKLIIKKGFFSFSDFWVAFREINGESSTLVHHRWATHGALNRFNCHPWSIDENHAMIHNGVIDGFGNLHNGRSDTGDFTEFILKPMIASAPNAWREPWFIAIMSKALHSNKVIIMDASGEVAIYGEHLGVWENGIFYSNRDYLPRSRK